MDKFFRSFLDINWEIGGERVSFLDALLFVAITGSGIVMRLALMWGFTGWYGIVDYAAALLAAVYIQKGTGSLTRSLGTYCFFVIMPTLLMVSSYWQKPDVFYIVLTLASFVCLSCEKWTAASVLYVLAVLMNVQALFVFPVFVILWILRRLPSGALLLGGAGTFIRLLLGKNVEQMLFGYGNVAAASRVLEEIRKAAENAEAFGTSAVSTGSLDASGTGNIPLSDHWANVYQFVNTESFREEFFLGGIVFTAAALLAIFALFYRKKFCLKLRMEFLTELALFFAVLIPYFLPHMNARSGLLADCFALLLLFFDLRKGYLALVQLLISFSMYQSCLTGLIRFPEAVYSAAELLLLCVVGLYICRDIKGAAKIKERKRVEKLPEIEACKES